VNTTPNSDIRDAITGEQVSAVTDLHPSSERRCVVVNTQTGVAAMLEPAAAHQLAAELMNAADACDCDWPDWLQASPKPLRNFIQVDGWANIEPGDYVMVPDDEGDVLTGGACREPQRSGTTVRILIAADADQADIVRIIRKQLDWIENRDIVANMRAEVIRQGWEF
jgi:hypothetical protein